MHKFRPPFYIAGFVFLSLLVFMLLINLLRRNVYDRQIGINLLLIGRDGMGVISIRSESGVVGRMKLPDNLSIPIESNGAAYLVEAIYKIGLPVSDPLNSARESVGQALLPHLHPLPLQQESLGHGGSVPHSHDLVLLTLATLF